MIIISWNCWGLGNQRAVNALTYLVGEKAPKVLFLMEIKQIVDEMRRFQNDLHFDSMLAVPCLGRRGRLAMLWKAEVDLHIQTYTQNHIDALILNNETSPWRITGFYGKPEENLRHETWNLLKHLSTRISSPWVCIGDYNEILSSEETEGRLPRLEHLMQNFSSTLLYCGLIDMGFTGNMFTWENGREGEAFVNSSYSDHVPILLNTQVERYTRRNRKISKRFEEKWVVPSTM